MLMNIFPDVVAKEHIGDVHDFSGLMAQCLSKPDNWLCKVRTSQGHPYDWSPLIEPVRDAILSNFPTWCDGNFTMTFEEPWMNVYEKGSYQEIHQHLSDECYQMSFCYFWKIPQHADSGKFYFYNDKYRMYCANGFRKFFDFEKLDIGEWAAGNEQSGDLIIFPSFMPHQVTSHGIDDVRVTIAGNVRFDMCAK